MLDKHNELKTNTPDSSPVSAGGATKSASPAEMRQFLPGRLWRTLQHYPIPFGSVVLLVASLVFWLAGHGDIANWTLLVVVLLGGIPLLWEIFQQFLCREFSVDVIAMLAIAGLIAWLVFTWFGLAVLRQGWINLDFLWSGALLLVGAIVLIAAAAQLFREIP